MEDFLNELGIKKVNSGAYAGGWIDKPGGKELVSINPATGKEIARVIQADEKDYEKVFDSAAAAFKAWQMIPAPKRGEIVRQIADELRKNKKNLGRLVSLEMGKILAEGEGEVQEMIDIADFAVVRTMASTGRYRDHIGVQFPGGGLVLERNARGRLR